MKHALTDGYTKRAAIAWVFQIAILVAAVGIFFWLAGEYANRWFITLPAFLLVFIGITTVTSSTIDPAIEYWLRNGKIK